MERVQGIRGSYNRSVEVYNWLCNHGWKAELGSYDYEDFWDETKVYYIIDGTLYEATENHPTVKLLDVVELSRWRADKGETYYYVSNCLKVLNSTDMYCCIDDEVWASGNYFKNEEDAMVFLKKILAVREELKM